VGLAVRVGVGVVGAAGVARGRRTAAAVGVMTVVRAMRAAAECLGEHALEFVGLVAGQFAAGNFAIDEIVDLRLEIAGRGSRAAGLVARAPRLQ